MLQGFSYWIVVSLILPGKFEIKTGQDDFTPMMTGQMIERYSAGNSRDAMSILSLDSLIRFVP